MDLHALVAAAADAVREDVHTPPPTQRISTASRYGIVALHTYGVSNRKIAEHLSVTRNAVAAVLKRWKATGVPHSGSRTGRPRATDEETDVNIVVTAKIEPFTPPRGIKRKLDLEVSPRTVDRRLIEAGLYGRVARRKRKYTNAERVKRLAFANGYRHWTAEQWKKVLFSDEKCFFGDGYCGRTYVRRPRGDENEALQPEYTVHKTAHSVKVNVWACFCAAGVGYMHIFNENMDAALLKSILAANVIPSAHKYFSVDPPEQWYLQHDNDKKFTSGLVKDWMHNNGVTALDFPPYSPDLNPIENLWAIVAKAVEERHATTMEELQDVVAEEWEKVDTDLLAELVRSMPARCQAVIDAQGGNTKY